MQILDFQLFTFILSHYLLIMANKIKSYSEAELIKMFGLERRVGNNEHPLMEEWNKYFDRTQFG